MSSVLLQRGPYEGSLQPPGQCQPTLLPSAGRTLSNLHPDNSLFIPDCSVLQTFLKFGGKWKIITLQVENYFNCHSDVLVHRNLLSTFHRRELLILLLPFCQAFSLPTRSPSFLSDNSPPLYSGPKFSLTLVCRAIPFFSLFLTLSFQTMTLEVLTFDSQYFDKVFS